MTPNLERCSVVVAGAWNQAIFTPEWVAEALLDGAVPQFQLMFDSSGIATRFITPHVQVIVLPHQAIIKLAAFDNDSAQFAETVASRLLSRLPETPVTAFGINFGFDIINEPCHAIDRLFGLSDTQGIVAVGGNVASATITRKVLIGDKIVNIIIASLAPGTVHVDFNHHYAAAKAEDAALRIEKAVASAKDLSVDLAKRIYGLTTVIS